MSLAEVFGIKKIKEAILPKPKETYAKRELSVHALHQDLLNNPLPKGLCIEIIGGVPIDVAELERMSTYKTSPRFVTSLVDNVTAKVRNDILGYRKHRKIRFGSIIWIIIGAAVVLVVGLIIISNPELLDGITSFFNNLIPT